MAKKKEIEKVEETPVVEESVPEVVDVSLEPQKESVLKKVFSEVKAFLMLIIIIGAVGLGTWYWYTHVYDGNGKPQNKEKVSKDGNIYSYSSDASHIDLTVLGNYLVERNDSFVTKIMDLKTEKLYEGKIECNYFDLGIDNNLYFVSDESGENENTITLYKFDGENLEELDPISKVGVYYAPLYYEKGNDNILLGFSGSYYTQDDYGDDVTINYLNMLDGRTLEIKDKILFGNQVKLGVSDQVTTKSDRYVITTAKRKDKDVYGLYDLKEGKDVIDPSYEILKEINNNRYVAVKNGKAGIIDVKRKILVDFKYDFIDVNDGFFVISKNNKLAIMDNEYNIVTNFEIEPQSGIEGEPFSYSYYLCCSNNNTFKAYKVGNKYILVTNYLDYGYFEYDKHEAYIFGEDGKYETLEERSFEVNDGLIYALVDENEFIVYDNDLTEKYTIDLTKYDFEVYGLELLNENTIVAKADKNDIYIDYESGEEIDRVNEFNKELGNININYKSGKLTIKTDSGEKKFDISNFDYSQVKEVEDGYYYIDESSSNSIYVFVEKEE